MATVARAPSDSAPVIDGRRPSIAVVDDDSGFAGYLRTFLALRGYDVRAYSRGDEIIAAIKQGEPPDIVLLDVAMPGMDGLQTLKALKAARPEMQVIMLSGREQAQIIVEAVRLGAADYVVKPGDPEGLGEIALDSAIKQAIERTRLVDELTSLRRQLSDDQDQAFLGWGDSPAMRQVAHIIEQVADSDVTVLIRGESGVGKELVARAIHQRSTRKNKPFVAINCAAIPETLIESEIFGHEKGAFTGALERRTGCFELAESGTLLLDEIGEMPAGTQAKLLRVLEDRKLRRLGSKVETSVDVRVLAATNKVPEEAVARGELRNDLYYRLNVFNIHMPPLREHKDDVPDLVQALLADMNQKHQRKVGMVNEAVMQQFMNYSWPGNVRELRNTLERAIIVCEGAVVEPRHLPPAFGHVTPRAPVHEANAVRLGVGTTVGEAERLLILKTLESTNNNKTRAAEILGISLKTLHNKLKEYSGLNVEAAVPD